MLVLSIGSTCRYIDGWAGVCCLDVDDLLLFSPDDPGTVQRSRIFPRKVLLLLGYVCCACTPKIQLYIFRGVLHPWKKRRDMFSEGSAAHPVGVDSPLQIVLAVWYSFFEFELAGLAHDSPLQIGMAVWRASNLKKVCQTAINICRGLSHPTRIVCRGQKEGSKGTSSSDFQANTRPRILF